MLAIPSNFLTVDSEVPAAICEQCGEEREREIVNIHWRVIGSRKIALLLTRRIYVFSFDPMARPDKTGRRISKKRNQEDTASAIKRG